MNKLAWRRTWFQVHKWIGLLLAILIVPVSLSGAALVWDEALDGLLHPGRHAVSGTAMLPPAAYVAAARQAIGPGERVAAMTRPDGRGPVIVSAVPGAIGPATGRDGPAARTLIYLDPPTAHVLGVAPGGAGLVRFLHKLHGSLFLPGWGRTLVGWVGVATVLMSMTGLWLWWPTVGSCVRGLLWRRHRDATSNLHHMAGFWIALPLLVLSLTGAWIAFPRVAAALTGGGEGVWRPAPAAPPLRRAALDPTLVVTRAERVGEGRWVRIDWPTERSADWTVTMDGGPAIKVADDVGTAVPALTGERQGTTGLMRRLHDGTGMGPIWQLVIFLAGLIPALLAVTGVLMWVRARAERAAATRKRPPVRAGNR